MATQTSTLDIRLIDDVSPAAQRIAAELRKLAEQGKNLDGVLANSGTTDKMQANLKKIGAGATQVEAVGKAWRDFAKEQGVALGGSEKLTSEQIKAVRNWENTTVAGVKAVMSAEKARDSAAQAAFEKNVSMWRQETAAHARENERRVADDRRAAEQSAQIHRREIEREQRDRVREYETEQRMQHRALEERTHGIGHHGVVNYALQTAAMAVSAHEVVNVGREAWAQGAELQHERLGLQNAGRTPREMREIEAAGRGVVGSVPTAGMTESLKTIAETTAAFGSVEHAVANLPFITKATSVLKAAGGDNIHGDAASLGRAFAKTFEERQTRPQDFEKEAKAMIPAMVATGGTFNPEQLYAFAQQAKSALPSLSMRFLGGIAPSLIGAQGGDRAGTGLNAFENVISGKAHDKKQAEMWMKMGLLDPSKTIMTKGQATSWQSGAVKDTFLAMTDPLAWSEKYLIPALQKQGVDPNNREAVKMILDTMFRNQNANMFASEVTQAASRQRLHKDEDLYGRVGNFDQIYARNMQDFGVAAGALKTALGNLGAAVTAPLMTRTAGGLTNLATMINGVSVAALEHPTLAGAAGVTAAGGSLALVGRMAWSLQNGFGLKGAAVSLDAAAAHLMEVSGTGGLGSKLGGGALATGVEAGVPALAIPGAVTVGAGVIAAAGAAGVIGLVKEAVAAQAPGQGGQYAAATPATEGLDRARLADQQAEAGRLQSEIDRNERASRIPGGADVVNLPLRDQLANVTSQITLLQGSLRTLYVSPDREAERGRALADMAARRPPEMFGPNLPQADSSRTFGAYLDYSKGVVGSGESMPQARRPTGEIPGPADAPKVDTSGLDAAKEKAAEVHASLEMLNASFAPSISTASLDALIAKAHEAAAAIAAIGSGGGSTNAGAIRAASNRQFSGASRIG